MGISNLIMLTGHRKGGTNVFRSLFDNHPNIYLYPTDLKVLYTYFPAFTAEFADNPSALRDRLAAVLHKQMAPLEPQTAQKGFNANDFVQEVLQKLDDTQLTAKKPIIQAIANSWVELYYQSDEHRPFVFTETSQALFYHQFARLFPGMKVISLVRDPRDNYASIFAGVRDKSAEMGEDERSILAAAINRARLDLMSARLNQSNDPEHFMALRFEDLATDPSTEMKKVADFIGVPFRQTMTESSSFGEDYQDRSHEGELHTDIEKNNVGRWPERIPDEQAMVIEAWMRTEMTDWGYTPFFSLGKAQVALAEFYDLYNARYFYHDQI